MKESFYNISISVDDKNVLLYNTLTTSLVILDSKIYNMIFQFKDYSNGYCDTLFEMGFFVSDDFDEWKYLENLRKSVIEAKNKISNIIIAPTLRCNANCYYCFLRNSNKKDMDFVTADSVINYLVNNWNGNLLNISWFGGEPLLAEKIIDHFSLELTKHEVKYESKIITNGLLITPSILDKAKKHWNTQLVQISIDAIGDEYNKIKNYEKTKGSNPFNMILDNLMCSLESGISVRVRINTDPVNTAKSIDLMHFLHKKYSMFANFKAYFAPIDMVSEIVKPIAHSHKNITKHPYIQLLDVERELGFCKGNQRGEEENFIFDANGLLTSLKIYPNTTNCYASCPNVFSIDPLGDLYKCHRILGRGDNFSCGNIKTGIVKNNIHDFFCSTTPSLAECHECKLMPICQGGCKVNFLEYKDIHACVPFKSVINELIMYYMNDKQKLLRKGNN